MGHRRQYGACGLHAWHLRLQTQSQNMSYLLLARTRLNVSLHAHDLSRFNQDAVCLLCGTDWIFNCNVGTTGELRVSLKILYIRDSITNCRGSKNKSRNTVTMKMIVTLDRARPSAGNIKGWDWSAVRLATVQVTEPSSRQQLSKVKHYQLHRPGLAQIHCIYCT